MRKTVTSSQPLENLAQYYTKNPDGWNNLSAVWSEKIHYSVAVAKAVVCYSLRSQVSNEYQYQYFFWFPFVEDPIASTNNNLCFCGFVFGPRATVWAYYYHEQAGQLSFNLGVPEYYAFKNITFSLEQNTKWLGTL